MNVPETAVGIQNSGLTFRTVQPRISVPARECESGGIGRRAGLRSLWSLDHGGSIPPFRTRFAATHDRDDRRRNARSHRFALRREWRTVRQIGLVVGLSPATAARVCRAAGLSRLRHLEAPEALIRYEREKAGELLHVDIKRLGRFDRVGHRITRKRSFGSPKQASSSSMSLPMTSPVSASSTSRPTSAARRPAPS